MTVLINQSLAHVNLSLFLKQPEQASKGNTDIASGKVQDRASSYAPSQSIALEGIYSDPHLSSEAGPARTAVTDRALGAMKSLQGNELKNLEAAYRDAFQAETGRELAAGERLSVDEWQSMSGDLRRSGAQVNLLGVQLAVANGDFEYAGSIDLPGSGEPSNTLEETAKMLSSMANFRTLQIQNVLTKMSDGSLSGLAEKLGGSVNTVTEKVVPLSKDDLQNIRDDLFAEMIRDHQRSGINSGD